MEIAYATFIIVAVVIALGSHTVGTHANARLFSHQSTGKSENLIPLPKWLR